MAGKETISFADIGKIILKYFQSFFRPIEKSWRRSKIDFFLQSIGFSLFVLIGYSILPLVLDKISVIKGLNLLPNQLGGSAYLLLIVFIMFISNMITSFNLNFFYKFERGVVISVIVIELAAIIGFYWIKFETSKYLKNATKH